MNLKESRVNLEKDSVIVAKSKISSMINNRKGDRETDVYIDVIKLMVEIKSLIKGEGFFSKRKRKLKALYKYCYKISLELV